MKLKNIHIGEVIKQKFDEKHRTDKSFTKAKFAEQILCERSTVYDIFKRKSIDSEKLSRISQALDFDFVNEIYHKQHPMPQTVFAAIEMDKKEFKKLDLPPDSIRFIKVFDTDV
jgi:hypothetical protein